MNPRDPNVQQLQIVAQALGHSREKLVLVGGCATGILITDNARPPSAWILKNLFSERSRRQYRLHRSRVSEIYAKHSFAAMACPFMLKLRSWWQLAGITRLADNLFPVGHGSHATPSEIAITQSAYPDTIKAAVVSPKIAPTDPIRDALDYHARFPDGHIGSDPLLASPGKGAQLNAAAAALIQVRGIFARKFFVCGFAITGKEL